MNHVHLPALPWEEFRSPTGKFHSYCQNVSLALGGLRNTGTWGGGHPFDLQVRRIPPGAAACPFHLHLNQWEMFIVQAGSGTVRTETATHAVSTGDVFIHPPGAAHQLANAGKSDLVVYLIADHPSLDACHCPDSNKWVLRPPGKYFRMIEVDFFDGEDAVPGGSGFRPAPASPRTPLPAFSDRRVRIDDLPWEPWESPRKKFRAASKELSLALGAKRNTPVGLGGHPFDIELGRLAPGQCGCPFHSHASQWELFVFLTGSSTVRTSTGTLVARAGDVVLHPPGEAHQFTNTGDDDVLYYLIADNPPADYWHYPDSGKWGFREPRKFFRTTDVDYWDGEE